MGEAFFLPYLYVPSAEATYMKLVTPWGNVQMSRGFLLQLAGSVAVLVTTLLLWWCSARLKERGASKKAVAGGAVADGDGGEESEGEEGEPRSALEENLVQKGENSYYYAHQARETADEEEPVHKTMVSSYGWSDDKKVKWTNMSLSMDLLNSPGGDEAKSLVISTLFHEITDVQWKVKKNTLTITLTKAQEMPWTSLNGAAKRMEDHIEYDESFYN
ncbi:hypothetical protein BBJ28_00016546 [Nothophytophthora sp. Chile5]|nr:hypothetical protein BBJ28_00016546 [Nothophytophthora sp. Chile5]